MKEQIERISFIPVRVLLAAIMGFVVLVCFAQPAAPQVSIDIIVIDGADHIKLSWEPVEGAESYNIYNSFDPNAEVWGEPIETVGDSVFTYIVEESVDELGISYFFYVTVYAGTPDWLVLVDGDQFNGDITIDPFLISKYHVTQEDWIEVMRNNPSRFAGEENLPVEMVSWYDAIEYCNRLSIQEGLETVYTYNGRANPDDWYDQWPGWKTLDANHTNVSADWGANGYRLPTEAEWHHAANGAVHDPNSDLPYGSPFSHSGTNEPIDDHAWYSGNAVGRTHPVGTKEPNALGIYDMSGNVFDWCWDIHLATFPSGGDNPRGAIDGPSRVTRGGSWLHTAPFVTVSRRGINSPTHTSGLFGFRVARNVP